MTADRSATGFTAEERAAMQEHAQELKDADRTMDERLHAIVMAAAPELEPRTWSGMPAYALDGQVVCVFRPAGKLRTRYATPGFSDKARLDEGDMWPNAYAVMRLTETEEARIAALVRKAVS